MAKISPVSIKYMVHASFIAEGALEKPDVIGAIFGQTEGLLGADLEMRELQKEGKIGRIEVDLERNDKKTTGMIKIPTALDRSETTLLAAAVETIERIGPSDAQIEIEKIEDVRGSKRDYIIERAKKLMSEVEGSMDSRDISNRIKDSSRTEVIEYGKDKLPSGDLSSKELIVVEGRADVINLMKNGVKNVIAMNGTNLPETIRELSEEKEVTLFIDGDRGGNLIAKNVVDNARIAYIAVAPDGKEVEELQGKEVLMCLRKKVSVDEFFSKSKKRLDKISNAEKEEDVEVSATEDEKETLKKISEKNNNKGKAILLDKGLNEIKTVASRAVSMSLKKGDEKPYAIVVDGTVTEAIIKAAEEKDTKIIVGKNFSANSEKISLLSL